MQHSSTPERYFTVPVFIYATITIMNQKIVIIAIIVIILFVGGIWFATLFTNSLKQQWDTPIIKTVNQPLFTDLRLGTPVRASFATQKNPPIKQKIDYTVGEPIMLQGTTISTLTSPVSVSVRLVDATSKITNLKPSTVSFGPGTSSYCCWTIDTPGKYIVQVLRPDSITTALPITITRDLSTLAKPN